ncbi:flagellar biosynthesis protein FlhF [Geomonas silvestris]|uniref:Flagellar biosynthesis protein FlhF n=2 Tax=Geomonas silvestris TaxID=2740184 RepID=A0A6V8MGB5_9BACT|nr:flagellar biosynthesis protein FlhF [Geomonas silvestris]
MVEALKMVKAEMGLDAMILSSKKERKKGILGFFSKPYFEVTAALEPRPVQRPNPYRETPEPAAPPARELSTKEEFQNSMLLPLAREVRELKQRLEALTKKEAAQQAGLQGVQPAAQPAAVAPPAELPRTFGKEDLEEIKKLLFSAVAGKQEAKPVSFPTVGAAQSAQPQAAPAFDAQALREQLAGLQIPSFREPVPATPEPEAAEERIFRAEPASVLEIEAAAAPEAAAAAGSAPLAKLAQSLRDEELSAEVVEMLVAPLREAAAAGAELADLRAQLAENLAGQIKCSGALRMKKNGPRIMAIVGPTGVGKTTTIAKLAAMHALNRGASVAMVTADIFRVGAIEQLKTYAKIMDLPLEVAATDQELANVLAAHADKDLILIDTTGRSHKDSERLAELRSYLTCHPGIEICLCMSATTRSRELDEIVATFGELPVSRVLFTKLDESESYGSIVNAHLKHKLPVSYLTTGQKVPEDIEVATGKKLASLVVKESAR